MATRSCTAPRKAAVQSTEGGVRCAALPVEKSEQKVSGVTSSRGTHGSILTIGPELRRTDQDVATDSSTTHGLAGERVRCCVASTLSPSQSTFSSPPSVYPQHCLAFHTAAMLSRFAPRAWTAPVRSSVAAPARFAPVVRSVRTVTTDAASSHAEKDDVPTVSRDGVIPAGLHVETDALCRRMTSLSKSASTTSPSRPTSSTPHPIRCKPQRKSSSRCTTTW